MIQLAGHVRSPTRDLDGASASHANSSGAWSRRSWYDASSGASTVKAGIDADTLEVRARTVAAVMQPHHVVTDRTAAWIHGVDAFDLRRAGHTTADRGVRAARPRAAGPGMAWTAGAATSTRTTSW